MHNDHAQVNVQQPRCQDAALPPKVCTSYLSGSAYVFEGSWEEVLFAPAFAFMQQGCQASPGVKSRLPSPVNNGSLEGSSTAENAMPTRMPCFLRTRMMPLMIIDHRLGSHIDPGVARVFIHLTTGFQQAQMHEDSTAPLSLFCFG